MAIPTYWAKKIWLGAISHVTGKAPDKIDPTDDWDKYMAKAQLREAFNETNAGLAAAGVATTWVLAQVAATNPISKQIDLLAATATPVNSPKPLTEALTRYTHRHLL